MPTALINGINLYYEVHGQGQPLILIQGLGGGHQAWVFQVRAFQKHFLVVTFDNRGIGKSDKSREPYNIRVMADDVINLMNHLSIGKAHILGASLGGMVAQEIAISYPQRVDKLILCSAFTSREATDATPDMLRRMGIKGEPAVVDNMSLDSREFVKSVISLAFNKWSYRMLMTLLFKFHMKSTHINGWLEQMGAVRGYATESRLHLIHAPTLVITGTADRLVPPHFSEMIASRIPGARLVKVDSGSHAFFIEMSSQFNKEVLDFLLGR